MIKFFRKIRQNLLMENKTGKYFKYAIGEIILVVIGILIALQINNWNENRKTDDIRENYLKQLLVDLETDKIYYNNMISTLELFAEEYNDFYKIYGEPGLNASKFILEIQKINFLHFEIEFKTSTIKTLISTGDIKLFESTLRNKLTTYNGKQKHIMTVSNRNANSSQDILKNAMMNGANSDLLLRLQNQPNFSEYLNIEKNFPKLVLELEAFLNWKKLTENYTISSFNSLIKKSDNIIESINKELAK
jgi:hypothetical protein